MSGIRLSMKVWDLPVRLFHWVLVCLVLFMWATGSFGPLWLHFLGGYAIISLLVFRVIWGLVGSDTARFRYFLHHPRAALAHLAHFWKRDPDDEVGHNAAGGWMVVAMLVLLVVQVGTGLFSRSRDTTAPFAALLSKRTSHLVSDIHGLNFTLIQILVGLHILAIIGYAVVKRHDLVRPMVTGKKRLPATFRAPRMASPWLALAIWVVAALCVWGLISLAPVP